MSKMAKQSSTSPTSGPVTNAPPVSRERVTIEGALVHMPAGHAATALAAKRGLYVPIALNSDSRLNQGSITSVPPLIHLGLPIMPDSLRHSNLYEVSSDGEKVTIPLQYLKHLETENMLYRHHLEEFERDGHRQASNFPAWVRSIFDKGKEEHERREERERLHKREKLEKERERARQQEYEGQRVLWPTFRGKSLGYDDVRGILKQTRRIIAEVGDTQGVRLFDDNEESDRSSRHDDNDSDDDNGPNPKRRKLNAGKRDKTSAAADDQQKGSMQAQPEGSTTATPSAPQRSEKWMDVVLD